MNRSDDLSQLRLRYIQVLVWFSIILSCATLVPVLIESAQTKSFNWTGILAIAVFIALNGLWLMLIKTPRWRIAAYGLIITFVGAVLITPINILLIGAVLAVITAAALGNSITFVATTVVVLGKIAFDTVKVVLANSGTVPPEIYSYIIPMIAVAIVALVVRYFINNSQQVVTTSRANADLLQSTSDVGQVLSQILNQDELVERAVELISARFGHYHVQIFLVNDTRDQAVLVASTGEVGKRLLSRGHQLSVGSQSVIGQVILRSAPVLVSDTEHDPVYYRNELLPNTHAELALPIRDSNQTIGALDIQSTETNAFSKANVQALQIMADLLATMIRNARLFKQQAETVQENDRLYRDAASNFREIERLNQQLTRMAWQDYHTESNAVTGVTLERDQLLPSGEWSESLIRAGVDGQVVEDDIDWDGNHKTVAVPVMLRGEVIGAIEVQQGMENNPETLEMVQAVAQRLALSLENARLYEATLQAAAQEQRINDIAARFQSVATVDELLRITLAELSETLGAERGSIRLGRFTTTALDTGSQAAIQTAGQNGQNGGNPHD